MIKNTSRLAPALAGLGLATLLFSPLLQTQGMAQAPQDNGGPGGPPPGGPGGFGGPGGGFGNRRPPFAFGTVTAVDAGAGTITLSSQFGGGTQTIQTQGATQITTQVAAKVSDLKVGDQIQVQGVPTSITATSLTIGQSPFPTGGGPGGPAGGPGSGPGGPGTAAVNSYATATGTVATLSPLTITLSPTVTLALKMDASAKVIRYTTLALSGIKVGDRVMGQGTTGDDGTLSATTLAVNVDMGGRGQGGYGGRGRGGFGRRGGQGQGGPQGGGNPGPPPPAQ